MKLKTIVSLALLASGCGPEQQPDFITSSGVKHYGAPASVTKGSAEVLESVLFSGLSRYGYTPENVTKGLQGLSAVWVEGDWPCDTPVDGVYRKAKCAGQAFATYIKLEKDDCAFQTAYGHELLHEIQGANGIDDPEHKLAEWHATAMWPCGWPRLKPWDETTY